MTKSCLEHLQYFHIWSCSLQSKYKVFFCRIPCNQRYKHPQTTASILFWSALTSSLLMTPFSNINPHTYPGNALVAWMVALLSSYSSITHWVINDLSFDFEQTALIFLTVINWMWSPSNCCGIVDYFLIVPYHSFHLFWNNFWSNCQYWFYSIQLQVCHKWLTL